MNDKLKEGARQIVVRATAKKIYDISCELVEVSLKAACETTLAPDLEIGDILRNSLMVSAGGAYLASKECETGKAADFDEVYAEFLRDAAEAFKKLEGSQK